MSRFVVPHLTRADEHNASSVLWRHGQKFTLKINVRVQLQHHVYVQRFEKQLLDNGNRKMANNESTQSVTVPKNFCKITSTANELIQKVFTNIAQNYNNHQWLGARAILAAKNNDVNAINFKIQNEIPGEATTYKSIDTIMNQDKVAN